MPFSLASGLVVHELLAAAARTAFKQISSGLGDVMLSPA